MLRIHNEPAGPGKHVLRLEGTVTGPWVQELRRLCDASLAAQERLALDLSGVTFLDNHAIALLRALAARGAELRGASTFIAQELRLDGQH